MQDGSVLGNFFRNKWVRFVLIVGLIVAISIAIFVNIDIHKDAAIVFNVAPVDATITINGNSNYTNGANSISPGDYEIKISHEGLEPKTIKVNIAPRQVVTVSTFLSGPDNNFDFYELKENYGSMQMLETIASRGNNITTDHDTSAETFISAIDEKLKILDGVLPLIYSEYTKGTVAERYLTKEVSITKDDSDVCQTFLCVKVTMLMTTDVDIAKTLMEDNGANLNDFEVIYETY